MGEGESRIDSEGGSGQDSPAALRHTVDLFVRSIRSTARVEGLTHNYYRYPARFPPDFARTAILAFSEPGQVVMDPFMGGGTTAVETLSLGRRFIGADVNPISRFVTKVKTTPLSDSDVARLLDWVEFSHGLGFRGGAHPKNDGWRTYREHIPWWLERQIAILLRATEVLPESRQRDFARCTILRTAQWALDSRRRLATGGEFLAAHSRHTNEMIASAVARGPTGISDAREIATRCRLLCRSAEGIGKDPRVPRAWKPVRLVVTSPPYPGVHVLYHRWQVQGRRETATPFWIVGSEDGHSSSFYTMGPRYAEDLSTYLVSLESSFRSIASMLDRQSKVVQLIGFSDRETQLGPVLDALESAGLEEVHELEGRSIPSRLWRRVPNRKWHASSSGVGSEHEVLLIHRLAS